MSPQRNRLYTLAVNCVALFIAFFLLYFRLPDAIEASIARTAHDYYVEIKESKFPSVASAAIEHADLESGRGTSGEDEKDVTFYAPIPLMTPMQPLMRDMPPPRHPMFMP